LRLIIIGDHGVNLDLVIYIDLDYGSPEAKSRGVRLTFAVATGRISGETDLFEGEMSLDSETFWGEEAEVLRRYLRAVADADAADLTRAVEVERELSSRRAEV
jgi:hypothetical protein